MWRASTILMWLLVMALTPCAWADTETETARKLYESATRHFDLTEYDAALDDFKEGYRHKDDPVFLYNIAQCYRLLNKNEDALKFYRNYLRRSPNATNREEVERRIATLRESIAAADRARQTPPQTTLPPPAVAPNEPSPPASQAPQAATPSEQPAVAASVKASAPERRTPVYKKWFVAADRYHHIDGRHPILSPGDRHGRRHPWRSSDLDRLR